MDTTQTITHVSLCAGYGGIDLGLKRAIPSLRTVAFSEIEAFACANLVAKMEAGLLDPAPIWTDLKTFPWEQFHGKVDILSGGYPCQPFSAAGKRLGQDDPRHLWPFIANGIRILRPSACFFENVEGHITLGLRDVLQDLAGMGYRTTWGIFSASEVGAPHQRKRVFVLAYRTKLRGKVGYTTGQEGTRQTDHVVPCSQIVADIISTRLEGFFGHDNGSGQSRRIAKKEDGSTGKGSLCCWPSRPGQPQHDWEPPRVVGQVPKKLADFCSRDTQSWGDSSQASGQGTSERGESADPMSDGRPGVCGGDQEDEPPRVVGDTAMSGLETQWHESKQEREQGSVGESNIRQAQPTLGRDSDGPADWMDHAELYITCDNRTDELRLLGNGVVPATAELAFKSLIGRLLQENAES